jgi:hypothetical protein
MSKNQFEGFFENENHAAMSFNIPTTSQVIEALMMICGQNHQFYKDASLRLIICGGLDMCEKHIIKTRDEGKVPDIHVGYAAFMMLLADRMVDSYDDYAGDKERELFPLQYDEDE